MVPPVTIRAFSPRRRSSRPVSEFTNATASSPKRRVNFAQPVCGLALTSSTASAPIASRVPGREVGVGDVQVDVQLVAGEGLLVDAVVEQAHHPGTHHGDLRLEVGALGYRAGPGSGQPAVTDQSEVDVEDAFVEDFTRGRDRAGDDELEGPDGGGLRGGSRASPRAGRRCDEPRGHPPSRWPEHLTVSASSGPTPRRAYSPAGRAASSGAAVVGAPSASGPRWRGDEVSCS